MSNRTSSPFFDTVCTLPDNRVRYVTSPNTRGTCDILFSCLFTLFICTWNIQHLNIQPDQPDSTRSSRHALKQWAHVCLQKSKWMGIAMLAPEYMLGLALNDHVAARKSVQDMAELAQARGFEWTNVHAYYANMGGLALKFRVRAPYSSDKPTRKIPGGEIFIANEAGNRFALQDLDHAKRRDEEAFYSGCPHPQPYNLGCSGCRPSRLKRPDSLSVGRNPKKTHIDHFVISESNKPVMNLGPVCSRKELGVHDNHRKENMPVPNDEDVLRYLGGAQWRQLALGLGLGDEKLTDSFNQSEAGSSLKEDRFPNDDCTSHYPIWEASWAMNAAQIHYCLTNGILDTLPPLSRAEIEDKSKSDAFVKATAIVQVSWLVCQVISRKLAGLDTSQLEIAVFAFAVLTCITYVLIWNKPQDVRTPTIIRPNPLPRLTRHHIAHLATEAPWWITNGPRTFFLSGITIPAISSTSFFFDAALFPSFFSRFDTQCTAYHTGFGLGGALFGALHCLAWSFTYPSATETHLWRAASVYCAVYPFASTVFVICIWPSVYKHARKSPQATRQGKWVNLGFWAVFGGPYTLARLYIMVESVRSMAYLPVSAYRTVDWSRGFPHAG